MTQSKNTSILNIKPLGFPWETQDPFLFCVHHRDEYPKGNNQLGPDASLSGRAIGQDFTIKDGWRMKRSENNATAKATVGFGEAGSIASTGKRIYSGNAG